MISNMLDFVKLGLLVSQIGIESLAEQQDLSSSLEQALAVYGRQCLDEQAFAARLAANAPWILWPTAMPLENLSTAKHVPPLSTTVTPWTVLGVDGSQIMPSHHEVHNCYLLNCGLTRISYGLNLPPLLTSEPRLYARPEDLYPLVDRRRIYIDELYVSLERSLFELELLTERALAVAVEKAQAGSKILAMYDGSLIPWSAEKMSPQYLEDYLARFEACLDKLCAAEIALVGYLSKSRAGDVVNNLRSALCPYQISHCREHCGHLNEEDFPCSAVWPLSDRALYGAVLGLEERSGAMLQAGTSVVKSMAEVARSSAFCYPKKFGGGGQAGIPALPHEKLSPV